METTDIDLNKGLSEKELDALIGKRDYKLYLNSRNELYRERDMKNKPPTRAEAIALMAKHPNLIKRPILVAGDDDYTLGFDEAAFRKVAGV